MSELTNPAGAPSESQVNEARVRIYEQLMEAEELIAHALYRRGVSDEAVVRAMDVAEAHLSESDRRENLYLSSLGAYVEALGGRLELRAVFEEEQEVVVLRGPGLP